MRVLSRQRAFDTRKIAPYLFLAPVLLIFVVFVVYPFFDTLLLSFQKFEGGVYTFAGIGNYTTLFRDTVFQKSLRNTCLYLVIQVPVMVILSLTLAAAVDNKFLRGKAFFRMSLFLPAVTALVAYSMVFKLLLNSDYGLINYMFTAVGLPPVDWLNTTWGARLSIIMAITWRWTGYNMIVMLAGIQAIPTSAYESAEIDGANSWNKFWRITVPMTRPIILFVSITSTIGTLQLFDESYTLTDGGPNMATISIAHYLYNTGFRSFKFGYAAAISIVLMLIIGGLSLLQFKLVGRGDEG